MNYVEPQYVTDGQIVWLITKDKSLLPCEVIVAAGNSARIGNGVHRIDKWVSLSSLRVPEESSS